MKTKIIKLLDPAACFTCPFSRLADVETDTGKRTMRYCTRLDCDNWDHSEQQAGNILRVLPTTNKPF